MTLHMPCRFTDRYLAVNPHGSGVKLTIEKTELDQYGHETVLRQSIFLDHQNTLALAYELNVLAGNRMEGPIMEPRQPALEATEVALFDLERAIKAARQKIAEALA